MSTKKTTVRKKLDKLWSQKIREVGSCQVCGKSEYLNAHHIIGRTALNTRWDLQNGICLCSGCHTFNKQSAHNNPLWFVEWLKEFRFEQYEYLQAKRKETPISYSLDDYIKILEELNENKN